MSTIARQEETILRLNDAIAELEKGAMTSTHLREDDFETIKILQAEIATWKQELVDAQDDGIVKDKVISQLEGMVTLSVFYLNSSLI
jgi:uncharacterized coiled-coil protein SlyX